MSRKLRMAENKYVIGIDEVGRGPLAGPVSVGVFCLMRKDLRNALPKDLKDSKALSRRKREEWFGKFQRDQRCNFAVSSVSSGVIDHIGISSAIRLAISRAIYRLGCEPRKCSVLLDGGLRAPLSFDQKTIIGGDAKVPIIAAASIVAKVTRDKKMIVQAKKTPGYDFEKNMGYGTKFHLQMLKTKGLSSLHRKTFVKT